MKDKTAVIAMSGGVDSSVSAALLQELGYRVIGLFMKNWEEKDDSGQCRAAQDEADAQSVCTHLSIPLYTVNFVEEYWEAVFSSFLSDLKKGYTPNPDVLCNREIKFKVLFEKAFRLGADVLATGHYCQTNPEGALLKGKDPHKDQSYFLYTLKKEILQKVLFPVGALLKPEVRLLAKKWGLPTAEKKDSTGICFIGKRDFKTFISKYIPYQPGDFITPEGKIVGGHDGAAYYTIGQRKGLGIGGAGEAWFVIGKDIEKNTVTVAQGEDHPLLYHEGLLAQEITWVDPSAQETLAFPYRCLCKIRYRQEDQGCTLISYEEGVLKVYFETPQRAITPYQSIVFYDNHRCLGGGRIKAAIRS